MKYIPILLLAVMSLPAKSQLLWRITGKGLASPSYIYGTMHLNSPKAFNFSDSVLIALQKTNTFALETDFDSTMALLEGRNKAVMSDTTNYIRPYLTEQEYHFTDSLLQAKSGRDIASLPIKLFPTVTGLIFKDTVRERGLFLDAWLFQKANLLGKTTYHLEKLQNQIDIFYPKTISPADKTEFLKQIGYINDNGESLHNYHIQQDSMMNLYYAGDLQKLGALILPSPGAKKLQLEKRNIEMISNLVKLCRQNSIFACAGAAHLPGPHGIIALLRKQGFTVTPVPLSYTGIAQRERQHLDTLTGYLLNKQADGFSAILPQYPQTGTIGSDNATIYAAGNERSGAIITYQDILSPGKTLEEITKDYFEQLSTQMGKPENITPITYKGIPGYTATLKNKKVSLPIRIFITNNKIYTFGYASPDSIARNKFFNTIKLFKADNSVQYETVQLTAAGISMIMPADWFPFRESTYKYIYKAFDRKNNILYYISTDNPPAGGNDLYPVQSLVVPLKDPLANTQLVNNRYIHPNGAISRKEVFHRGTSTFTLISTYHPATTDSSHSTRFFNSFKIAPQQTKKEWITLADNNFSISAPVQLKYEEFLNTFGDLHGRTIGYDALDTANQSRYVVAVFEPGDYEQEQLDYFLSARDNQVIVHTSPQEVVLKDTLDQSMEFRKAIISGQTIYTAHAYLPATLAAAGQRFLASFKVNNVLPSTLQTSKLDLLIKDLKAGNDDAWNRLSYYHADSSEVTTILNAMQDSTMTDQLKVDIFRALDEQLQDRVVHAAAQLFTSITGNYKLQNILLNFLSHLPSDSALRTFLHLSAQTQITARAFNRDLPDNVELYNKYLPAIRDTAMRNPAFLEAFTNFAWKDTTWVQQEKLHPALIKQFYTQLAAYKGFDQDENNYWSLYHTATILSAPGMPATGVKGFKQMLTDSFPLIQAIAARGLINQGIAVDTAIIKDILNDKFVSHKLITHLDNDHQLTKIAPFITQEIIGTATVADEIRNHSVFDLDDIEYLSRINITNQSLLLFHCTIERDNEPIHRYYLIGPFSTDTKKVNLHPTIRHHVRTIKQPDQETLNKEAAMLLHK